MRKMMVFCYYSNSVPAKLTSNSNVYASIVLRHSELKPADVVNITLL
jgi:hypothetical protein